MRREITTTRSMRGTPSIDEADWLQSECFVDGKTVFKDPVAYLRALGIEAELVEETAASLVPAA